MSRNEIKAFLPIERSLGSLAYDAMQDHIGAVVHGVKSDIDSGRFSDAHDRLRHVDFADAAKAIDQHAHVYFKSAFLLGASRVHGSLAKTPSHAIKRFPDRILESVTKVHREIVSQKASIIVKGAVANLIRKAQIVHHEGSLRKADGRSLYVYRKLLNAADVIAWAKKNNFSTCLPPEDMHVTVCYSKTPVDWSLVPPDGADFTTYDGLRRVKQFNGGAVVLVFRAAFLKQRNQMFMDAGATSNFPVYHSHVTLTYASPFPEGFDFSLIEPYDGPLIFGEEIYKEIEPGGFDASTIVEKFDQAVRLRKDAVSDLADALNSAVDGNSQMMASAAANISTTRLVAYGFLVEANANAVGEYTLRAVLDDRTTQICEELDGRTFKVERALNFMSDVLSTTDADALRALDPFLSDTQATVDKLSNMSDDDLQSEGVMVPPFHFGCRTTLEMVGDVTIEDTNVTVEPDESSDDVQSIAPAEDVDGIPLPDEDVREPATSDDLEEARANVANTVQDMLQNGAEIPQSLIDEANDADGLDDDELEELIANLDLSNTGTKKKAEVHLRKDTVDDIGMIHGDGGKFTGYAGASGGGKVKGQLLQSHDYVKQTPQYFVVKDKYTGKDKWLEKKSLSGKIVEKVGGKLNIHQAVDAPPEKKLVASYDLVKETPKYYVVGGGSKDQWVEKDKYSGYGVEVKDGKLNLYEKPKAAAVQSTATTTTQPDLPKELVPKAVGTSTDSGSMDVSGWKKVGDQKGSNPGGTYEDPDGNKWYVKTPKSLDHAKNELLANKLYALAGVKVPDARIASLNGNPAIASKIVAGPTLAKTSVQTAAFADAQKNFAADAWLANRDSVGQGKDNMVVTGSNGEVTRLDQGGALKYRAQGSAKTDFGDKVTEFDSLRDPKINKDAADVFGKMTNAQLVSSLEKLGDISETDIRKTVSSVYGNTDEAKALANTIVNRWDSLAAVYDKLKEGKPDGLAPVASAAPAKPKDFFDKDQSQIDSLTATKGSGLPLSSAEKNAIKAYTGNSYSSWNEQLRAGVMSKEAWTRVRDADNGLDKLPGHLGVTWRKVTSTAGALAQVAKYKVGMIVEEHGFTSSSTEKGVWSGDIQYMIYGSSGVDLNKYDLSSHPGEKEVLFRPGTRFEVLKMETSGKDKKIVLKEAQ